MRAFRFFSILAIAAAGCAAPAAQPVRIAGPTESVSVPESGHAISLITCNAGLMRVAFFGITFYNSAAFVDQRNAALPATLVASGADIIALQEVFGGRRKEALAAAARTAYPYAAWWETTSPIRQSSGLIVLSKWPITDARYQRFADNPIDEALLTSKGFLEIIIEPNNGPRIRLFDFHMTAGGNTAESAAPSTKAVRAGQIRQVLAAAARPFDGMTILLGDLNAGPGASVENYAQVLDAVYVDAFAAANRDSADADLLTWDPRQPLIAGGPRRHTLPRRIDHVFLPVAEAERIAIESARIVFTDRTVAVEGLRVPVSDHYGVQARLRLPGATN